MSKPAFSRLILFIMVILLFYLFYSNQAAMAEKQKNLESTKIEIIELEKTIETLENPEEAKKLATQLRGLLGARKKLIEEKKEVEKPKKEPTNLFKVYESHKDRILSSLEKIVSEIKGLPLSYNKFKAYISKKGNLQQFLSFFIQFFITLVVVFITWMGLRKYTKKLEEKLSLKEPLTLSKKIGSVFIATSFKIYPWIALYLFSYIFLLIFPVHKRVESIILHGLLALILYFGLKNLIYFLFSPDISKQRVIPIKDELANYVFIWCRRILLFSLWMYLLIMPSSILNRPALAAALSAIYKVGLVIMLAIILAQWKGSIKKTFSLSLKEEDPTWKNNLKRTFNYIMGKLYLVAILYLGLVVTLSILGLSQIYTYLLYSTAKSIIAILFAIGLWLLWGLLFKRLFQVSNTVKEKYPELEEQVNRYVNYLGKAGYFIILLFATLTILDIWGLEIYEFMASNVPLVKAMVRIPLIIIAAIILTQIIYFLISKLEMQATSRMLAAGKTTPIEIEKRVSTLGRIFRKAVLITIITITAMMVFAELGFDIKPILAGAGIVGLAVGFGAQNLVRDVISGLFIIFENRIRVGDVAIINGTGGLVEQINLRTTVLRDLAGVVHVFPNGVINTLSNMTHEFSYYIFDVGVAYKEDTDRVVAVLKEIGEEIMQDEEYRSVILEPLEILGVDQFAESAVVIKARIKTLPIKQWLVGREINRRIKKRFDELGIEIPFPHRTFYFGEVSKPISLKLEGLKENREEMKELIREVLQECGLKQAINTPKLK